MEKSTGDRDFRLRSIGYSCLSAAGRLSKLVEDADDDTDDEVGELNARLSAVYER